MVGLIIRASRGRLNFIQRDGALSRLELKFVVPILWTGDIVLAFAFAVTWKIFLEKHRFTHFNGAVWFLIYLPSSISYVLLSTTVAAGAPPIRRFFGRMQYGVIWFNLIIALIVCASCVGMILPALKHADAMVNITNTYNRISGVIQDARAKQDMTVLPGIVGMLPLLGATLSSMCSLLRLTICFVAQRKLTASIARSIKLRAVSTSGSSFSMRLLG